MRRRYGHVMPKSEWNPPSNLKVGDKAIVLWGLDPKDEESNLVDVACGDTTVTEIKKNGTIILANKYRFHSNGYGHAANNAMILSDRHALERDKSGKPVLVNGKCVQATKLGHYSTF